ncbi:hypothetical protein [Spirosoma endbachense]|uniref:hypothetical protein n=1 Tax=Spirosoma endbachense TaxID=2666025 RepID=UPI00139199F7|nr:hypothetical protein [Spirosoma endbachense]
MADQAKFEYDDWVGAVRPDPRNTDQVTLLQGYIGQSSESGHIRVYSDDSLNGFVEVPEEAIVYALKLSSTESSLGGSRIWIRSDTVVTHGDPKLANRPKSTFLEGDIMQQYGAFGQPDTTQMQGFAAAGQPDTTLQAATIGIACGPLTRVSVCQICVSTPIICRTRISICQLRTCFVTQCGLATCQITFCGKSCFRTVCCIPADRFPITKTPTFPTTEPTIGPTGPFGQPGGAGFMGGQPDTTQMGGYYGTFNPYMY